MKKTHIIWIVAFMTFVAAQPILSAGSIVFSGTPKMKVSTDGTQASTEKISGKKASEFRCTISKIGDKYYWTTRENLEMIPSASGIYITFMASNGAGYVKIVNPEFREFELSGHHYVEHLILGLSTINYYGSAD